LQIVFKQGEQITALGDASVNRDYAPIYISNYKNIADKFGDYPGVCSKKIIFYLGCPDPNLLLKPTA
jgi:hypothetical protein